MKTNPVITGWCPNHRVVPKKKEGTVFVETISKTRGSGPQEGTPGIVVYSHRQIGIVQIWASVVVIVALLITSLFFPEILFLLLVAYFALGFALLMFSTLTVDVKLAEICITFGPVPLIRRRIPLEKIQEFSRVVTPWYYGWGLRYIRNGTLYNISGYEGVEVLLSEGKRIRIGTNDPVGLIEAIKKVTDHSVSTR